MFVAVLMFIVLPIIALIFAIKIVNFLQRLIMNITDSGFMFYSMKAKLVCYGVAWYFILAPIYNLLEKSAEM